MYCSAGVFHPPSERISPPSDHCGGTIKPVATFIDEKSLALEIEHHIIDITVIGNSWWHHTGTHTLPKAQQIMIRNLSHYGVYPDPGEMAGTTCDVLGDTSSPYLEK